MAKNGQLQRGGAAVPGGRPGLEPAQPLSPWSAIIQVLLLLGIPIVLLLFAKVILKTYFPGLGY